MDSASLSTHGPLTIGWSAFGKGRHEYPLVQADHLHESHGPRVVWVKWYSPAGCKIVSNCRALGHRAHLCTSGIILEFQSSYGMNWVWEVLRWLIFSRACLSD